MNSTDLPVMFIKKPNGGVHTARNAAYSEARGKFITCLDSDDEFLPEGCALFVEAWDSVPEDKKHLYWGVAFPSIDQNGKLVGDMYPENANSMEWQDFVKTQSKPVDRHGFIKAEIVKSILLPEPEGINFVSEPIFWERVGKIFRQWSVNKITRVIHLEGNDHLSRAKFTLQTLKNNLYSNMYRLNLPEIFHKSFWHYLRRVLSYRVHERIINESDPEFVKLYPLEGRRNRFWYNIMRLPSKILLPIFKKKHGL